MKIGIVLDGLRNAATIAEIFRREGIPESLHCSRSKEFLDAGKQHPRRLDRGGRALQENFPEILESAFVAYDIEPPDKTRGVLDETCPADAA